MHLAERGVEARQAYAAALPALGSLGFYVAHVVKSAERAVRGRRLGIFRDVCLNDGRIWMWAQRSIVRDGSRLEPLPRQTCPCSPVSRASGVCDGCGETEAVAGVSGAADAGPESLVAQGAERQGRRSGSSWASGSLSCRFASPLRGHANRPQRQCQLLAMLQGSGLPAHLQHPEQDPAGPVAYEGQVVTARRYVGPRPDYSSSADEKMASRKLGSE